MKPQPTSNLCLCDTSNPTERNLALCQRCSQFRASLLGLKFSSPSRILPGLWLGGLDSATDETALLALGIRRVLVLMGGCCMKLFPRAFTYLQVPLDGSPEEDLVPYLVPIMDFVQPRDGGILVHSIDGGIAAAAIIAYLTKRRGMTGEAAVRLIRERRKEECPVSAQVWEQLRRAGVQLPGRELYAKPILEPEKILADEEENAPSEAIAPMEMDMDISECIGSMKIEDFVQAEEVCDEGPRADIPEEMGWLGLNISMDVGSGDNACSFD